MFCPNCGNNLEDGSLFCDKCGASISEPKTNESERPLQRDGDFSENTPVANETSKTAADGAQNAAFQEEPNSVPKKSFLKKWRTPKGITITAVIAAVVAAAIIFSGSIAAMFKRVFYPADSYAGEVVGNNVGSFFDGVSSGKKTMADYRMEGELSFIIGDSVLKMLPQGENAQILSMIKDLSVKFDGSSKDGNSSFLLTLCKSGASLLSGKISFDGENNMMYGELPELTSAIISLSLEDYQRMLYGAGSISPSSRIDSDSMKELIEKADFLEKSIANVVSAAFKGLGDGEKDANETLEVGSVDEKCTYLEFKLDAKAIRGAIEAAAKEIGKDDALLDYMDEVESFLVENDLTQREIGLRELIIDALEDFDFDELEETLELELEDQDITLKLWISRDESIAGVEVSVDTKNGRSYDVFIRGAEDGNDSAFEIGVKDNDTTDILFSGEGKKSGGEFNGDYALSVSDEKMFDLNISGFDTERAENGYLKGTFTLSPTESLIEKFVVNSDNFVASSILSSLAIRLEADCSEKLSDVKLALIGGDEDLIGFKINFSKSDPDKIELPDPDDAYDAMNEKDLEEWADTIDFSVIEKIFGELGIPKEVVRDMLGEINM